VTVTFWRGSSAVESVRLCEECRKEAVLEASKEGFSITVHQIEREA
jgi:hypothetical protein